MNSEKIQELLKSEEKFDREYIESVQKLEGAEAQKTIRQYQILVAVIKIVAKIAFVLNFSNLLNLLAGFGIEFPNL